MAAGALRRWPDDHVHLLLTWPWTIVMAASWFLAARGRATCKSIVPNLLNESTTQEIDGRHFGSSGGKKPSKARWVATRLMMLGPTSDGSQCWAAPMAKAFWEHHTLHSACLAAPGADVLC